MGRMGELDMELTQMDALIVHMDVVIDDPHRFENGR